MSFDRRNLVWRVLVAAVAIPVILSLLLTGAWGILLFAAVLSILAGWEWADLCCLRRMTGLYALAIVGPTFLLAATLFDGVRGWAFGIVLFVVAAFTATLAGPWREAGAVRSVGAAITGTLYVGFFALMVPISGEPDGETLLVAALFTVWLCDTLAYFGGTALGRHRLAPTISPKKSWEGAAFGFVGAVLGGMIAWLIFRPTAFSLGELACLGAVVGVVGQVGDLAESVIKRDMGKKDSSNLIPGHGGVLDRFDSFLFSLPVLWGWLYLRLLW